MGERSRRIAFSFFLKALLNSGAYYNFFSFSWMHLYRKLFLMLLHREHFPKEASSHCISITFLKLQNDTTSQILADFSAVYSKLFRMTVRFFCTDGILKVEKCIRKMLKKYKTQNFTFFFICQYILLGTN